MIDIAAQELGLDRLEIRRRNFLKPEQFPVNHGIIFQDFTELTYDTGDYQPGLDRVAEMIGYEKFIAEEQPELRRAGRHVGIGVVAYVEGTGIGPYEGARVQVQGNGRVFVATGMGTQGQGHYTAFAQLVGDQLGIDAGHATWSPATRTSSNGARALLPAVARLSPAMPFMQQRST